MSFSFFQVDRTVPERPENQARVPRLRQEDDRRGSLLHHLPPGHLPGGRLQVQISGRWTHQEGDSSSLDYCEVCLILTSDSLNYNHCCLRNSQSTIERSIKNIFRPWKHCKQFRKTFFELQICFYKGSLYIYDYQGIRTHCAVCKHCLLSHLFAFFTDLCVKVLHEDCNSPGASKVVKW